MSKSRGRRSKVELETPAITSDVGVALSPPPGPLDQKAKVLWYSILANRPVDSLAWRICRCCLSTCSR